MRKRISSMTLLDCHDTLKGQRHIGAFTLLIRVAREQYPD